MKNLAIIPARSGSKGVIDKNVKLLNGKPLIAYTIEAAIDSGMFDCVYVSTDSEKYAETAIRYGAKVPFLRSKELAGDNASSWDVIREALRRYEQINMKFDTVALLQPTSPLRTSEDIRNAFHLYCDRHAKSVVSVCETEHSPFWTNVLPENLSLNNFINIEMGRRRQELPTFYRINGAIYIIDVVYFLNGGFLYDALSYAYIMPQDNSIDIDTELDFKLAKVIMDSLNERKD